MAVAATAPDEGLLGIGELSRASGVPVRTIRFYCDEGVLEADRTGGNHRRFDASAVDRLALLRRLRALGLGLPAIRDIQAGHRSIDEAIAAERTALGHEIASLTWRHAALTAVEAASPADRAIRLSLLSAAAEGAAAHRAIRSFWAELPSAPTRPEVLRMFLDRCVPEPPPRPTPEQVVTYAALLSMTTDHALRRALRARGRVDDLVRDDGALLMGMREAFAAAATRLSAGASDPGDALHLFVRAHAKAAGRNDTPDFRRTLLAHLLPDRDPRLGRYWRLVADIRRTPLSDADVYSSLLDALERSVA